MSRNHSNIDENPVICNFVSSLLLPWSSRVVPKCQIGPPRCSRDAKMAPQGAPEVPKRLPECQKGRTKGPAVEGVALKILEYVQESKLAILEYLKPPNSRKYITHLRKNKKRLKCVPYFGPY